ncbi:MAG: hypothetical protein ABI968_08245 [Acidobacteriota bacterium]
MSRRATHDVSHAFALSVVAFVLHLAWESIQCPVFFEHGSYDASPGGMALASVGDVGITWALYAAVALVSWQWRWSAQGWSRRQWAVLLGLALAIGWGIEARALANHRWSYKALTPLLPGLNVSVIPILQLLVLAPLIFRLADLVLRLTELRARSGGEISRQQDVSNRFH